MVGIKGFDVDALRERAFKALNQRGLQGAQQGEVKICDTCIHMSHMCEGIASRRMYSSDI